MPVADMRSQKMTSAVSKGTKNASGSPGAENNAPPRPYAGLHFWVEIDGIQVAGFSECSAITCETEFLEYTEGGFNSFTHKLPVRTKYSNVTLKRGIDSGKDLYQWYLSSMNGGAQRKNVSISLYTSVKQGPEYAPIQKVKQYNLRRAYPVKWSGPDMKAETGAIAVESLEFAFEGLTVESY